jgi:Xaa-Pro aminopeptidase
MMGLALECSAANQGWAASKPARPGLSMRYKTIDPGLFVANRERLKKRMLKNALAVLNANDILPANADGVVGLRANSDLFYLTGVEQEETILLLYPEADDEKMREVLFLRETSPLIAIWEGHKLTKEEARRLTGIQNVQWLSEFPKTFRRLMCECEQVYLNSNEHKRAVVEVETRDARFIQDCRRLYPLHQYHRLARLMHELRVTKSPQEIELIKQACALTAKGFRRVARFVKSGVTETEVEAEFAHEFIRGGGSFAYPPIIAAGPNACVLHYVENCAPCQKGQLLLLDVAASLANYNSDLTRTLPVNGRFSRRQKQVYQAVLRVFRQCHQNLVPGKLWKDWQKEAEQATEKELVDLHLITTRQIKKQDPDAPAFKQYFMHGVGHPIGLDVHDVGLTTQPMQAGWVMTIEPAIYIKEEGLAVRLENTVVVGEKGNLDLMAGIPIEADEIEDLMNR